MSAPVYDTGCSCDGTCTDCSQEMRADLDTVLAVLDLAANGHDPHGIALVPGSAAQRVADALAAKGGTTS
jgi:hypothetical protein